MEKEKNYLGNLTGLRFYASVWVFFFHLAMDYIPFLNNRFTAKGYLGVDVFFVLSGFILTFVYFQEFFVKKFNFNTYYHFLLKRFAKIYPLHLLTFVVILVMVYVGKYYLHQDKLRLDTDAIIPNLMMTHAWGTTAKLSWNFVSWSISAEWFAYVFLFAGAALLYRLLGRGGGVHILRYNGSGRHFNLLLYEAGI